MYSRYIDDVFFTSNESIETINGVLDKANSYHPNIKLVRQIGTCIPFLDVLVENQNGSLFTSVYHKEAAEPHVLPFMSDHPRHMFSNIIQGALFRAVRYSSTIEALDEGRRNLEITLLYNG
jgi:hypothetical protein